MVSARQLDRHVAQRDPLGEQLVGITARVLDEAIATPRLVGGRVVATRLGGVGVPRRLLKTLLLARHRGPSIAGRPECGEGGGFWSTGADLVDQNPPESKRNCAYSAAALPVSQSWEAVHTEWFNQILCHAL